MVYFWPSLPSYMYFSDWIFTITHFWLVCFYCQHCISCSVLKLFPPLHSSSETPKDQACSLKSTGRISHFRAQYINPFPKWNCHGLLPSLRPHILLSFSCWLSCCPLFSKSRSGYLWLWKGPCHSAPLTNYQLLHAQAPGSNACSLQVYVCSSRLFDALMKW